MEHYALHNRVVPLQCEAQAWIKKEGEAQAWIKEEGDSKNQDCYKLS